MDINKQIEYWINSASEDLESAELLITNKKILHGLFLCHLCIEKSIKAHVVRYTDQVPPKSHKLSYLVGLTDLLLSEDDKNFCAILMVYQLEGRYQEYYPSIPSIEKANDYLRKTKVLHEWLKMKF